MTEFLETLGVRGLQVDELFPLLDETPAAAPKSIILFHKSRLPIFPPAAEDTSSDCCFIKQAFGGSGLVSAIMSMVLNLPGAVLGKMLSDLRRELLLLKPFVSNLLCTGGSKEEWWSRDILRSWLRIGH